MLGIVAMSTPICHSSPTKSSFWNSQRPRICFPANLATQLSNVQAFSLLSTFPYHRFSLQKTYGFRIHFSPKAAASSSEIKDMPPTDSLVQTVLSGYTPARIIQLVKLEDVWIRVGSAEYVEEPATNVKFQTSLTLPGCSSTLLLLGTGFREKVFAIIGVKVYAAGLYVNQSIISKLAGWKGRSAAEIQEDSSLFDSIFQAPPEKSLQIVLVRDVDGKTFWDALDDAISPRIKTSTPVDQSTLSTFRSIFQGRTLKKGTFIFLTWLNPGKMLVCVSSDGLPSGVDAAIESMNVTSALFDVFFGGDPVSPSLKASVANGLATILK